MVIIYTHGLWYCLIGHPVGSLGFHLYCTHSLLCLQFPFDFWVLSHICGIHFFNNLFIVSCRLFEWLFFILACGVYFLYVLIVVGSVIIVFCVFIKFCSYCKCVPCVLSMGWRAIAPDVRTVMELLCSSCICT